MRRHVILPLLASLLALPAYADDNIVKWEGFVDGQYAYDFNTPTSGDRSYTTQPSRHNEFNVNLAYIGAKYETTKIRARLAMQAGTSVQSNYSAEPTNGTVSGPNLSRHLQEARVGYRLGEKTWVDAGVFFSHVGVETWISKDNMVLTKSLTADYSPYYLSGVKLTHQLGDRLTGQLLVTNGWQNISENNTDKNVGASLEYSFNFVSIAYNTMIGNEVSPALSGIARKGEARHFHDLVVRSKGLENWEWAAQVDTGFQRKMDSDKQSNWYGTTLMARYKLNERQKISARLEHFRDDDQIVIVTGKSEGLNAVGGSLGFDQMLDENFSWRSEARYLKATDKIMPKQTSSWSGENCTLTTSLALSF